MEYVLCVETFWINIEVLDDERRGKKLKNNLTCFRN